MAGMFLWIKLLGIEDSQSLIAEKALAKEVGYDDILFNLLVPGRCGSNWKNVKLQTHVTD